MGTSITSTGVTFPDATTQTTAATTAFGTGTVMLFAQTAAPTGWTKDATNYNNSAIRIVTGTVGTGGSVDFTTAFASQTPAGTVSVSVSAGTLAAGNGTLAASNGTLAATAGTLAVGAGTFAVGATTITTAQMPSHNHPWSGIGIAGDTAGAFFPASGSVQPCVSPGGAAPRSGNVYPQGGGGSHTHSLTGAPTISGTPGLTGSVTLTGAVTLTGSPSVTSSTFSGTAINLAVKYVDVIRATKN